MWLRLLRVIIATFFRPRLGFLDESVLWFVVSPGDLDVNVHMNNARYLAVMDLGRADLLLRTGLWTTLRQLKLAPVLGATMVRYRRSLKPFQRFCLRSRLVAWDEKWFYIEHIIQRDGVTACSAVVKATFVGQGGTAPPAFITKAVGYQPPSPDLPAWVQAWRDFDASQEQRPLRAVGES